jgi:hypothetical protein
MVLRDRKKVEIVDECTSHMISSPTYSSDGKRIAYMRVKLMTRLEYAKFEQSLENLPLALDTPVDGMDMSGPEPVVHEKLKENMKRIPAREAELVIRDAKTFKDIAKHEFEFPVLGSDGIGRVCSRCNPKFGPGNREVFFSTGETVMAADVKTGKTRTIFPCAHDAVLSPDRKTCAILINKNTFAFVPTDGSKTVYKKITGEFRHKHPPVYAWSGNKEIVVAEGLMSRPVTQFRMIRIGMDGGQKDIDVRKYYHSGIASFALSPNGRHSAISVVSRESFLLFLDEAGKCSREIWPDQIVTFEGNNKKVQKRAEDRDEFLYHPVFSPDSKHVAVKLAEEIEDEDDEDKSGFSTTGIVFFGTDGVEIQRISIPPPKGGVEP